MLQLWKSTVSKTKVNKAKPRLVTDTEVHYFPIMGHPGEFYSAHTQVTKESEI